MERILYGRKRIFFLLIITTAVAVGVGSVMLVSLYRAAFNQQRERLVEIAQSEARLIEAVARFDAIYSANDVPGRAFGATIGQIRDAHIHFAGFGTTGEFTLAKREGDQIVFLLSHRHHDLDNPRPVPFSSKLAEPMRRALSGESGTILGLDYRGERVLAAYEPVAEINLGIVAKIDLSEIRAPFIKAGLLAAAGGLVLIVFGTMLFLRVGNPIVQRLEESEEKYRGIFESAADILLLIDLDGTILDANPAACLAYGFSREELLGRNVKAIIHLDDRGLLDTSVQGRAEGGPLITELEDVRKDGTEFPVEARFSPTIHGGQEVILAAMRDITERKRTEEGLRKSEARYRNLSENLEETVKRKVAELRQSQRLAAIGQMVSVVAHEVKNPLQNIRMGVDAMHKEIGDDKTKSEILEEINHGVRILDRIIEDLLEYSRPVDLHCSQVRVDDVVQQGLKMLSHKLRNITVHTELEEDREILVDPIKFGEVLVNLISNAIDAMSNGGDLRICSNLSDIDGNSHLSLSISDSGCGIAEENLERIYEPFFTTKSHGTGLGISICKKIVEAHRGSLTIKSTVNKGTTVEISLPV